MCIVGTGQIDSEESIQSHPTSLKLNRTSNNQTFSDNIYDEVLSIFLILAFYRYPDHSRAVIIVGIEKRIKDCLSVY